MLGDIVTSKSRPSCSALVGKTNEECDLSYKGNSVMGEAVGSQACRELGREDR